MAYTHRAPLMYVLSFAHIQYHFSYVRCMVKTMPSTFKIRPPMFLSCFYSNVLRNTHNFPGHSLAMGFRREGPHKCEAKGKATQQHHHRWHIIPFIYPIHFITERIYVYVLDGQKQRPRSHSTSIHPAIQSTHTR